MRLWRRAVGRHLTEPVQRTLRDTLWLIGILGTAITLPLLLAKDVASALGSNLLGVVVGVVGMVVIFLIGSLLYEWDWRRLERRTSPRRTRVRTKSFGGLPTSGRSLSGTRCRFFSWRQETKTSVEKCPVF